MSAVFDHIGTANIKDTLGDADVETSLRLWLDEGVELGGLQEFGKQRDHILAKMAKTRHLAFGRGEQGGGPLVYNPTRYGLLRPIKTKTLVGGGIVGRLPGRRSKLGPSFATLGVFHDEILGERVTLISAHLTAEVQQGKGYRTDKAHRARVRRHKAEVRALRRLERRRRLLGNRVLVVMDSNFDGLELPPLTSCWDNRRGATLGSRAVDLVFAPQAAESVKTVATKSDHRAVVAVYRRKA